MCRGCCSCAWEVAIKIDTLNYVTFAAMMSRPGPGREPCHFNGEKIHAWKKFRRVGPGWVFECQLNTMKYKGRLIEVWVEFPNNEMAINVKLITSANQTRDTILSKMSGMCGGKNAVNGLNAGRINGLDAGRVKYPCPDCHLQAGGAGKCSCRGSVLPLPPSCTH
jgi:hypothetical protein